MTTERTASECAEQLVAALQKLGPASRAQLCAHADFGANDFRRGLQSLRRVGAIQYGALPDKPDLYALTGRPPPQRPPPKQYAPPLSGASFEGLLAAWDIRRPVNPNCLDGRQFMLR